MSESSSVVATFSGLGFLDLGLEDAGLKIDIANEISPQFMDGYLHSRESQQRDGDLTPIRSSLEDSLFESEMRNWRRREKAQFRGLVGGPPCPDFSIAGKQRGYKGDQGRLSAVYIDLAIEQKVDWLLFENVKGLWRTRKHRDFYDGLKRKLIGANYLVSDRLSNALEFGVPQDRDRIFLVAFHKRILTAGQRKTLVAGAFPWELGIRHDLSSIRECPWPTTNSFGAKPVRPSQCPKDLMVETWFKRNGMDRHPNREHYFQPRAGLIKFQSIAEGDDSRKSSKRLHRYRYSPTAAYGNNEVHLHPYFARRLSAAEALAVQSMPTWFSLPETMPLSHMFKGIGNGVPYEMAYGVGRSIVAYLDGVTT